MVYKLTFQTLVWYILLLAIWTLVFIFSEHLENFYMNNEPKIEMVMQAAVSSLYQYRDKVSQFIFHSILMVRRGSYPNLLQIIRQYRLRMIISIKITWLLVRGPRTVRRLWTKFWTNRNQTNHPITTQAIDEHTNPYTQECSTPICRCQLFPREFHWLLFDSDNTPVNKPDQKLMKLYDITKNRQSSSNTEHGSCVDNLELNQMSLDSGAGNDEWDRTGWSKEVLGESHLGVAPENRQVTGSTPTHDGNNSQQDVYKVGCECFGRGGAIHANSQQDEPRPSWPPGCEHRQPSPELENPLLVIFEVPEDANPSEARPGTPEQAARDVGPSDLDADVSEKTVRQHVSFNVPRSASTPTLCSMCPRPVRRFAMTNVAELMPVCFKLVAPFEKCPRTLYTLVNVQPVDD